MRRATNPLSHTSPRPYKDILTLNHSLNASLYTYTSLGGVPNLTKAHLSRWGSWHQPAISKTMPAALCWKSDPWRTVSNAVPERCPGLRSGGVVSGADILISWIPNVSKPQKGEAIARKRAEASQKKEKKEREKDDGRIHVKVKIICKQHKGVSELAAAGIWIIRLQCEALELTRGWHLQGGSDRKKGKCDTSSVWMCTGCLSFKLLSLFLFQQLGFLMNYSSRPRRTEMKI